MTKRVVSLIAEEKSWEREGFHSFIFITYVLCNHYTRFAKVFEFIDSKTFETFAGKVIPKTILVKEKTKAKLFSEIKIHSSLNHPHIVRFYHCFEDHTNVYLVMELCKSHV